MANVDLGRYRRIVQMFWDPEPTNDTSLDQPVWCLGRSYKLKSKSRTQPIDEVNKDAASDDQNQASPSAPSQSGSSDADPSSTVLVSPPNALATPPQSASSSFSSSLAYEEPSQDEGRWPQGFIEDFESRLWMTYRCDFDTIPKSSDPKSSSSMSLSMRIKSQLSDQAGFSSDSGWGCMIRSGQSLLANSILSLRLGRDWRRGMNTQEERNIISQFADDPRAPYSIHNFVKHGEAACGKYPGEWFGPSATARCIQALANSTEPKLRVYSTGDGPDVYEDAFMKIARPDGQHFHPTLILVGTRLGIDKITPVYWEALMAALQTPQSIGIAGGRPSSSHYFVGTQGSFLFYLDPHHTRRALPYHSDPSQYSDEDVASCHTSRLRRIHIREMDPSMLIGFLIQSEQDWADWRRSVKHVQGKAIIHVSDRDPVVHGAGEGREGAIDEVEPLSDDEDTIEAV
ncbi:peptidase family c54 domain-containing protein [Sarocladium implicatum]|nr:peptidase family c54 domain-containing protein [Sarocladium implicatum]